MLGKRPLASKSLTGIWGVAVNYTLAFTLATYAETASAAIPKITRGLPVSVAAFSLSSPVATPKIGWRCAGSVAPFALSYNGGNIKFTWHCAGSVAPFALSYNAAIPQKAFKSAGVTATYALTSSTATPKVGIHCGGTVASYTFTRNAAVPKIGRAAPLATGSFNLSYNTVIPKATWHVTGAVIPYALTSSAAVPKIGHSPFLSTASFGLAYHASTIKFGLPTVAASYAASFNAAAGSISRKIAAAGVTYTLAYHSAAIAAARELGGTQAAFTLSPHVAVGKLAIGLKPLVGVYSWTGSVVTPALAKFVGGSSAAWSISGNLMTPKLAVKLAAASASLGLSAHLGGFTRGENYTLALASGAYALAPHTVSCNFNRVGAGATGSYTTTYSALKTTLAWRLTLAQAQYAFSGHAATPKIVRSLPLGRVAYALNSNGVTFGFGISATVAHYTLTNSVAGLVGTSFIGQILPMVAPPPVMLNETWAKVTGFSARTISYGLHYISPTIIRARPPVILATGLFGLLFDVCPLTWNRRLPGMTATFSFGVVNVPVLIKRSLLVGSISYAVNCPQLPVNYNVMSPLEVMDFRVFSGTGNFFFGINKPVATGSFGLNFNDSSFGFMKHGATSAFALSPMNATISIQLALPASIWTTALNFKDVTMTFGWNAPDLVAVSAMGLSASPATCGVGRGLPLDSASYGFVGNALARFTLGRFCDADQASYSWATNAAVAQFGRNMWASTSAISAAWSSANMRIDKHQALDTASYGLTWETNIIWGVFKLVILIGDTRGYGLSPHAATPTLAINESAAPGAFTFAPNPAMFRARWRVDTDTTLYLVTTSMAVPMANVNEIGDHSNDLAVRFNSAGCKVTRGVVGDPASFGVVVNPAVNDFGFASDEIPFVLSYSPASTRVNYSMTGAPATFGMQPSPVGWAESETEVIVMPGQENTEEEMIGRVTTTITVPGYISPIEDSDE